MATALTLYVNCSNASGGTGTGGLYATGATRAFASLSDCLATVAASLTVADIDLRIELTAGASFTTDPSGVVTINQTTDATRRITIVNMDAVGRKWNTSAWRLSADGYGAVILVQSARVILTGLQIENTRDTVAAGEGYGAGIRVYDAGDFNTDILKCILKRTGTVASSYGQGAAIYVDGAGHSGNFSNNVIYGFYDGIFTNRGGGSATTKIIEYDNTIIGATQYGIGTVAYGTNHTHAMKNNITQGGSTEYYWEAHAGTEDFATNLSLDATSPTVGLRSKTVSFLDASTKDYGLDSGDTSAKGAGTDLSADAHYAFSDDINGDSRSAPWDIGAVKAAASASVSGGRRALLGVGW